MPWALETRLISSLSYRLVHYFDVYTDKFCALASIL